MEEPTAPIVEGVQFPTFEANDTKEELNSEEQKAIEDAKSFYANGASIELIAKSLNMAIEQVKEIVCEAQKA